MDWTSSDEQLYRALALEQRLSIGGNARPAEDLYGTSFPCTVSEIMLNKREGDTYIWKMPRRWYADPLILTSHKCKKIHHRRGLLSQKNINRLFPRKL